MRKWKAPWAGPDLDRHEAAAYLGIGVRLLDEWRAQGIGPVFQRIGRRVLYRIDQLDAYIAQHGLVQAPRVRPARELDALPCPDRDYSIAETCAWLHTKRRTLLDWRQHGTGPAWERHGRQIRYRGRGLLAFLHAPGTHRRRRRGR